MRSTALNSQVKTLLYRLAADIESANSLHLNNDAIQAENFLCELLNLIFSWNLDNSNRKTINQEGFDLSDDKRGMYVQVTSTKSHQAKYNKVVRNINKQTGTSKYKEFYLIYISQKVESKLLDPADVNGTNYEGWDIPKLIQEVFYRKKSAQSLEPVRDLLYAELNPFPLDLGSQSRSAKIALPVQSVYPINSGQFYIKREVLINELFAFTQEDNGLITGGPGYGKSFTITELQRHYKKLGIPCFVIRINELINGKADELNRELGTVSYWLDALKQMPSSKEKSLLVFDAFDTAKNEAFKANILSHIKSAIITLGSRWRVVASTRTYDALKSHKLAELFPKSSKKNAIGCRFIAITDLSEPELITAIKSKRVLKIAYDKASPSLKKLLRIPYFLSLFEQLVPVKETMDIQTEEQLLSLYWGQRVNTDSAKDLFLRNLTLKLASTENLSCQKSKILTEQNLIVYEALLSDGIITETSYTRENIAFEHNILLEYAVFKYAIPHDADDFIAYLQANERQPFLFRSSFIYFYSTFWTHQREQFWQHYFATIKIGKPLFRIFHQTVLNFVLVVYYQTIGDLQPIEEISNVDDKAVTTKKFLDAIRFIRLEALERKDIELLLHLSQDISPLSIWVIGCLTEQGITQFAPDKKRSKMLGQISYNYLEYYLEALDDATVRSYVENNGRHWAISNYADSISLIKRPKPFINRILKLLETDDFNINIFYNLAEEIVKIAQYDIQYAFGIYKKIYGHLEVSTAKTNMSNGVVMPLISNRKQDFESVHHLLESKFEELLELNSEESLKFGVQIVNEFLLKEHYWRDREEVSLIINGLHAKIVEDASVYDYETEKQYGPFSHAERIFKMFDNLKAQGDFRVVGELLQCYIQTAQCTTLWMRLLSFLVESPAEFVAISVGLLSSSGIYIFSNTRNKAGDLISASWELLTDDQKVSIEGAILNIPMLEYYDDPSMERLKAQLLSYVPDDMLVTEGSKRMLTAIGKIFKEDFARSESSISFHRTVAELKARLDIKDEMVEEHEAFALIKEIEEFNDSNINYQNRTKPVPLGYKTYLNAVNKLYEMRSATFPSRLIEACDQEISEYFSNVLQKFKKTVPDTIKSLAEKIAFEYLDDTKYQIKYQDGSLTNRNRGFNPSPRTHATAIIINLLDQDKRPYLADKILVLMRDNTQFIRFRAVRVLPYYYSRAREEYWSSIEDRVRNESDAQVLHEVMHAMYYKNVMAEDKERVSEILNELNPRLHEDKISDELERMFVHLLMDLVLNDDKSPAFQLIKDNTANEQFCRQFLIRAFNILENKNEAKKELLGKASESQLYGIVEDMIRRQFAIIAPLELNNPAVTGPFHTIDFCIQQLFFKVNKENAKRSKQKLLKDKRAYLAQIRPLLRLILTESKNIKNGFMVAHSGYYLMQLLNFLFPADPAFITKCAAETVDCAAQNNFTYDQSTMRETMKLVERVLADYKVFLKDRARFNEILSILDHFANSGWGEAIELIWKLREIF